MKVRELLRGDVERHRQKGVDQAQSFVLQLPEILNVDEKLDRLCMNFDKVANISTGLLDNFETHEFFVRRNHKQGEDIRLMLLASFQSVSQMEELVRQMDQIGRNKMNGHTDRFLSYRETCDADHHRLYVAKNLYLTNEFTERGTTPLTRPLAFVQRAIKNMKRRIEPALTALHL